MKQYTLYQYAEQVAHCHFNTVKTKIKLGFLPSNHIVTRIGTNYLITVYECAEIKKAH